MDTLEHLLAEVAATSHDNPTQAIDGAVANLLRVVRTALGDQRLRGMPNLGTEAAPFYGVNLGQYSHEHKIPFPADKEDEGPEQIVFTDRATIVKVSACRRRAIIGTTSWSPRTWFDFTSTPTMLTGAHLLKLVQILPERLSMHLRWLASEKATAQSAIDKAAELVGAMEQATRKP